MICPRCDCHHDGPHQWCLDCLQWKASGEAQTRREALEELLMCFGFNGQECLAPLGDEEDLEAKTAEIIRAAIRQGVLK
jgi:hypothetical protein